jgi:hypothetical protein
MIGDDDLQDLQSNIDGDYQPTDQINKVETANPPNIRDEESSFGSAVETGEHKDTEDMIESVTGNEPRLGNAFSLAEEIAQDEGARHGGMSDKDEVEESMAAAPAEDMTLTDIDDREYTDTDATPPDDKQ